MSVNIYNKPNIYRYKFTTNFTDELFKFAKIHQYKHRKDFKEAWEIWLADNTYLVDSEINYLTNLGYSDNITDKMYKSARYYFRKKNNEKKIQTKRRIYLGCQQNILKIMDEHIKNGIIEGDFKPSAGFDKFSNENRNIINEQLRILSPSGLTNLTEFKEKIKKTYKNRYFLIINKVTR